MWLYLTSLKRPEKYTTLNWEAVCQQKVVVLITEEEGETAIEK